MTVLSTGHDIEILITETEIAARTTQLARMIKEQYRDTEQLVVVGLLRGSFVFSLKLLMLALQEALNTKATRTFGQIACKNNKL